MTPEELAKIHPRLYHITSNSWQNIKAHGLLSTDALLDLFEVPDAERARIADSPRPPGIVLKSPGLFDMTLNDNNPLNKNILQKSLEDDLTIADWMHILNKRVYFWTNDEEMHNHLQAFLRLRAKLEATRSTEESEEPKSKKQKREFASDPIEVLVVDTLSLANEYSDRIELCAINSGVAIRNAAKRGLSTFTPMLAHDYKEWRALRGKSDKIKELTVLHSVKNIEAHVIEVLLK